MKWLAVGLWLIFTAGVLYWIEIKQNVVYIPETIIIESEVDYATNKAEYSEHTSIEETYNK